MPTHFLALPLTHTPRVASQLAETLPSPWNTCPPEVPRKALRPIGTLHLTLGVLHLENDEQFERAKRWLEEELNVKELLGWAGEAARLRRGEVKGDQKADVASIEPLVINLRSLKPMKGQPARSAAVLYLSPHDPTERLKTFAQSLRDAAVESGTMREEHDPKRRKVLLHATVVNTRHSSPGIREKRYDFTSTIEQCRETEWAANVPIDGVALCKMGARPTENGDAEYTVVAWRELAA
ncbi:hypothetical protein JCM10295v2_007081 [Rhodotorula toruloides]